MLVIEEKLAAIFKSFHFPRHVIREQLFNIDSLPCFETCDASAFSWHQQAVVVASGAIAGHGVFAILPDLNLVMAPQV
jgi:hypothetical protein